MGINIPNGKTGTVIEVIEDGDERGPRLSINFDTSVGLYWSRPDGYRKLTKLEDILK